ncbi:NAD-dependent succinate-semialdehyde dehydrogenase [Candidatus Pelagibacter ubique]|jgi:succinate-semialdehyde dehydrogenase/glutarate-semialdehyde dehydrogenase|nr:NAD-dependent succinate-semialdehyde dehydrogenase [Candidatus Pelagibacter bacterium]MDA7457265.1 NAD-dependent succinate-semialdehyde dehydrogenase [Candidatus Pelagibacter ubique]MDA8825112.1 NAD-dependent succinate-semialdehyde dehydrogenase [Candidatus Pelagibacter bacterium]MDA8832252.1 NAD-dependent succinate-semialdehyde dehydrogenase [Candidatus Pelagibacter bacterium]MDA9170299.1 NAD-dependent succinate-semialdehyde dehydrogenase [Candidatus Pelagibacter ubique]MDB3968333.1 NAD-de
MYNKFGQFIDGKWQASSNNETYDVINPATEEVIGKASKASREDVQKALKSAEKGLKIWRDTSPWKRSYIIRKIADTMREKQDVLAKWMTLEVGKPLAEGIGEVGGAADIFEWNAEETKRIYGQTVESRFPDTRVHVYYQPVGVVAALIPWNFPLILASRKISTALAAGCSVICKPDVITPGTVMELVNICKEAGVPDGVVNLLSGDPAEISEQLLESDIVKKVSITGSTRVGKIILKKAADKVQRVTMELSGHSPFIVFEDSDIDKVADMAVTAKFRNNGQVCISPNRFYIQESKKEEFISKFIERTKKLKIGNGMDEGVQLGPLTTDKRLAEIEQLVETTKNEGAEVLLGGKRPAGFNKGYFYEPTVFDGIKDDFTIMKQEPFGPLVPMLSFKTFDEVIERANNNDLGLCSYIYTNSMEQAHRASELIESGCVAVNTAAVAVAEAPFGGIKQTGYGREGGSMAIKDYLNVKYTHMGIKG